MSLQIARNKKILPPFLDIRCIDLLEKVQNIRCLALPHLFEYFFRDLITFTYIRQTPLFSHVN